MKAAYVNKITEIVENIIMVNSLQDSVVEPYTLVEISPIEIEYTQDELDMYDFIRQTDPNFVNPAKKQIQPTIQIGVTKWNADNGFH